MSMSIEVDNFDSDCAEIDRISDDDLWGMLDDFALHTKDANQSNNQIGNNKTKCQLCNGTSILFDSNKATYICEDCGCQVSEIFECRPEWTNYEEGNHDTGRCGVATNPFFPKSSTGTMITGAGCHKLKMLHMWDQVPYKERSLSEVLSNIESKLKKYKITKSIIDNAKILYKNLSEIKHADGINKGKPIIIRGDNRRGLIAACAFYGAKLQESPRSTKDIADIFELEEKQVTKGCRRFLELLNYEAIYKFYASKACDYITINAYKLNLFKPHIDLAIKITNNITKLDIASDHQPTSIAAGSIFLVSEIKNLGLLKSKISEIFQISEVTIAKTYKKIIPFKNFLINDTLTDMMVKKMKEKIEKNPSLVSNSRNIKNIFLLPDDNTSIFDTNSDSSYRLDSTTVSETSSEYPSIVSIGSNTTSTSTVNIIGVEPKKRGRGRPKKNSAYREH